MIFEVCEYCCVTRTNHERSIAYGYMEERRVDLSILLVCRLCYENLIWRGSAVFRLFSAGN